MPCTTTVVAGFTARLLSQESCGYGCIVIRAFAISLKFCVRCLVCCNMCNKNQTCCTTASVLLLYYCTVCTTWYVYMNLKSRTSTDTQICTVLLIRVGRRLMRRSRCNPCKHAVAIRSGVWFCCAKPRFCFLSLFFFHQKGSCFSIGSMNILSKSVRVLIILSVVNNVYRQQRVAIHLLYS